MNKLAKQIESLDRQIGKGWRRLRTALLISVAIGLSACVVLPADTVIYDDAAATGGGSASPDLVIIERGPVYVPPPIFWRDSHWGHRRGYRDRYRHGYRDGRRSRGSHGRGGARWEGRRGGRGAERGSRQRGGEFRGRTRSDSSSRSMTPHLDAK